MRICSQKKNFISHKGFRKIGDKEKYFRSKWEANFARYLEWQKDRGEILDWDYECKTFWFSHIKRGCVSYLPDFKIINFDGTHSWIEIKGYMDPKSKTKLARFKRFFKEERLRIIDGKWFKRNNAKMRILIREWE